uniref:PARP catalytic domain-containing protein n=1 Tax=Xenopus tropicalis TaxID=8364 RepID=A0A6I8QPD4_XENTR
MAHCDVDGFWIEERSPGFIEVFLQSNHHPRDRNIYVMYHGTTVAAATQIIKHGFKQSADGMLGRGVYVSRDKDKAARYPLDDQSDQVVLKLRVNVGRVKKIDCQGHPLQKTWHDHGYDTAWVPSCSGMVPSQLEEDCIWDPRRIKVVWISKAPKNHLSHLIKLFKKHIKNRSTNRHIKK